ncbi:ABC transporter substrate-binding protein [Photobacterium kishitanii]|uniref:ABC transporter substrate-binding protein n=1 Tax=Photobacterium kishitanii TaxID=318456 RepID=UPI001EFCBFFA|nr:ABC transporter substrate-binding protein [Photobacterium kishitanii]
MINKRKLELYENLFKNLGPGTSKKTITDIASYFNCSERHTRTLLKQMTTKGWLTWHPISGRGNRGEINCLIEPIDACYQEVDKATTTNNLDLVYKLIGFNGRDTASGLWQYLSQTVTTTEDTIFVPFHRSIEWLHPHQATERTERHLISEIYQTLLANNHGRLNGNLAHSWEVSDDKRTWTFYLRAETVFHDLSRLTAADVVANFHGLQHSSHWQGLYSNIARVESCHNGMVTIELKEPDINFAWLLCRPETAIMPKRLIFSSKTDFKAIGSGPFMLGVNSNKLVRLKRFANYNQDNALVENIEFWIHHQWAKNKRCAENFFFLNHQSNCYQVTNDSVGCFVLLLNKPQLQTATVKQQLMTLFNQQPITINLPPLINISHENNNDSRHYAALLEQACNNQSQEVKFGHYIDRQDIAICGIRNEPNRITGLISFLKLYPFWEQHLSLKQFQQFQSYLNQLTTTEHNQQQHQLNILLTWLNDQHLMAIISHEELRLTVPDSIQGVDINSIGWCNFKKLWIKPSAHESKPHDIRLSVANLINPS